MRARILTLIALLLLAGCSSVPSFPYKIEVQQGNVITQEMVDKLKPGMTRAQVRFALGSPMISDAFHENRWDYIYRLEQAGKLVEQRNLTVFFEDDKLVRIGGSFSMAAFNRPTMQHIEPSRQAGALPWSLSSPRQRLPFPLREVLLWLPALPRLRPPAIFRLPAMLRAVLQVHLHAKGRVPGKSRRQQRTWAMKRRINQKNNSQPYQRDSIAVIFTKLEQYQ